MRNIPSPRPRTTRPARPRSNGDNIQSAVSPDAALASREGDAQEKRLGRQDSNLRSVGHPRTKGDRILAEMREMDRFELRHMKGKEMEHRFKAVRSTCRHYRKQVLAENGDN